MRHVEVVRSNLKGGVACKLGPRTLIAGPRGSGKSAVVNALELALTGRVSDIAGRETLAKEVDLLSQLAPADAGTLFAEATLSEAGGLASWRTTRGRAGGAGRAEVTRPEGLDPNVVFPLRQVLSPLTGSPASLREFLLARVAAGLTAQDVEQLISESLRDHYRQARATCAPALSPADQLVAVLEAVRSRVREANARAKAARQVAASTAQGLDARPTETQLAAASRRVAAARAAHEAAIARESAQGAAAALIASLTSQRGSVQGLLLQVERAQQRHADALQSVQALRGEAAQFPPGADQPVAPQLEAVRTAMVVAADAADCVVCGATLAPGQVRARLEYVERATAAQRDLQQRWGALSSRYSAAEQNLLSAETTLRRLQEQLQSAQRSVADMERGLQQGGQASPTSTGEVAVQPATVTRAEQDAAEQALRQLESAGASWCSSEAAREDELAAERDGESWAKLGDECLNATKRLLDDHVDAFAAKVQARLPAGWTFVLQLRDGQREVARVGLLRDGQTLTALSGGEWATLTAAVADACVEEGAPLAIIVPEDRAMDVNALVATMHAFSQCTAQVILTTTNHVDLSRLPAGWTLIDTTRGDHRLAGGLDATPPTKAAKKTSRGKSAKRTAGGTGDEMSSDPVGPIRS